MASNSRDFKLRILADTKQVGDKLSGLKTQLTALATAVGIGLGVKELAEVADSYTNLATRIKITTGETGNFEQAMAGVQQLAIETNNSLNATAQLFTKINDVGKTMGLTQQQTLSLTKTINQAVQIGGGEAASTEAAIYQFNQALSSGVLRGDEFNSVMEQAPGLSKALANGLGVTTAELRKMAGEGQLTSSTVVKALQNQSKAVQAEFDKFPITIGNAIQRIVTQWQVLIGKFDQANGASKTVAQWMVTIADNISVLDTILKDVGQGVEWLGNQFSRIDTGTIEDLKTALKSAYDVLKSLMSTMGEGASDSIQMVDSLLSEIFEFTSGVASSEDKLSGFQKLLQLISVTCGFVADGLDAIGIAMSLLTGFIYEMTASWYQMKSAFEWGDWKNEAIASMNELMTKAEEHYHRSDKMMMDFHSKGVKLLEDTTKTQQQKDAESAQSSKEKFDKINQQSDENLAKLKANLDEQTRLQKEADQGGKNNSSLEHLQQSKEALEQLEKSSAERRKALNQQIVDAQKNGDLTALSSAKSSLSQIDAEHQKLTSQVKQYQTEVGQNAQYTGQMSIDANAKKVKELQNQEQELRNKQKSFTADGLDEAKAYAEARIKANNGVMDGTMQADLVSKGYIVTLNEQGKVSVEAWQQDEQGAKNAKLALDNLKQAKTELEEFEKNSASRHQTLNQQIADGQKSGDLTSVVSAQNAIAQIDAEHQKLTNKVLQRQREVAQGSTDVAQVAINNAKTAATALGIDLDSALNKLSKGFVMGSNSVNDLSNNLKNMGVTGEQAANVTYQGWQKWLETAKNQAEIDATKAKLVEFQEVGVFSTKQVEAGMNAIKAVTQKLPEALTPVEQAFERLGIKTKEQLGLAADLAIADFKTVVASGQATQDQLREAAERTMQAVKASGDASKIATANSQASIAGLVVETDKAGKTAVKTTQEYVDSLSTVSKSAEQASQSFTSVGDHAESNAERSAQAWEKAGDRIANSQKAVVASASKTPDAPSTTNQTGGGTLDIWDNQASIETRLKEMGLSEEKAAENAKKIYEGSIGFHGAKAASFGYQRKQLGSVGNVQLDGGFSNKGYVSEQLEILKTQFDSAQRNKAMASKANEALKSTPETTTQTHNYKFELGNKGFDAQVPANQAMDVDAFFRQLELAKRSSM